MNRILALVIVSTAVVAAGSAASKADPEPIDGLTASAFDPPPGDGREGDDSIELAFDGEHLRHQGRVVDLVYNRCTDFYFDGLPLAPLRRAARAGAVVLTDLGSRTGVFVRIRGEQELSQNDELLVGRTRLMVDLLDGKAA